MEGAWRAGSRLLASEVTDSYRPSQVASFLQPPAEWLFWLKNFQRKKKRTDESALPCPHSQQAQSLLSAVNNTQPPPVCTWLFSFKGFLFWGGKKAQIPRVLIHDWAFIEELKDNHKFNFCVQQYVSLSSLHSRSTGKESDRKRGRKHS